MFMCPFSIEWTHAVGGKWVLTESQANHPDMKHGRPFRLGTRGSRLALAQAGIVADLLSGVAPGSRIEVVPIRTAGDAAQGSGTPGTDNKLAFTAEIDRQLLEGKIDFAVHSLKDVPTVVDSELVMAAMPPRGDPRDALVATAGGKVRDLPDGSVVGTSSIRRKVQLATLHPGIRIIEVHGNVDTRIGKMAERGLDGVVLAAAGLERLGLASKVSQYFSMDEMVPAACQGILGVEARRDDKDVVRVLGKIDDRNTRIAGEAERAFLKELGGDCSFPVGAHAVISGTRLTLVGLVAEPDGSSMTKGSLSGSRSQPDRLGAELAERLSRPRGKPG